MQCKHTSFWIFDLPCFLFQSHGSTDTESSAASSIRAPRGEKDLPQRADNITSLPSSQLQQGLSTDLSGSSTQPQNPPPSNLEAQVREITTREGVTLPRTNPLALTSITIATRKRSSSSSASTSPAPPLSPAPELLHLTELSTEVQNPAAHTQLPSTEPGNTPISLSVPGSKRREDTVGGRLEEAPLSSQGSGGEDKKDKTQVFRQDEVSSVQGGSVSGVCPKTQQVTATPTYEQPARTGHVTHVHLTLSPKSDSSLSTAVRTDHTHTGQRRDFVPLRHSSSAASSLDEGVGLSSPPDWYDSREKERVVAAALFKPAVPQEKSTSRFSQPATFRPPATQTPGG